MGYVGSGNGESKLNGMQEPARNLDSGLGQVRFTVDRLNFSDAERFLDVGTARHPFILM